MKPRNIVFKALLKLENDGYSTIILNSFLKDYKGEDSGFITALFYGVIERKITLDYVINKYLDKDINKINKDVLTVLRMGLYEALYMNSPLYAVTNEYVSLIKASKFKSSSGLVNAILRKAGTYDLKYLSNKSDEVKYSVNSCVLNTIYDSIGDKNGREFFENSLKPAPTYVRINTFKEKFSLNDNFIKTPLKDFYLYKNFSTSDPLFLDGKFYVQDISAANSVYMSKPKEHEKILDLCSAPGGKSFTAYLLSNGKADITACDIYEKRLKLVDDTAKKLGFNIKTLVNDATVFNKNLGVYDLVICDVPCTGFGVIRRKPEIKYKEQDEINSITELQIKIVNNAVKYVKSGGRMLYSTCTLNIKENSEIVKYILENNRDFYLDIEKTMLPNDMNGDGFYAAIIRRR